MGWLADLLAPLRCVACGREADGDLCGGCAGELRPLRPPLCQRCGAPAQGPCATCAGCEALEGFTVARSVVEYGGPAARLVLALKRRGRPGLARSMGGVLASLARASGLDADLVTWVPAGARAAPRGFDHAELLARGVARELDRPCGRALARVAPGRRQAGAPRAERRTNAAGLFRGLPSRAAGRTVVLVDDVFTTGTTAEACALALLGAGARAVHVLTFARTVLRAPAPGGEPPPTILGS